MIGFGLDLAGYATSKTRLAVIEFKNEIAQATLLEDSPFAGPHKKKSLIDSVVPKEASALQECLRLGRVAVDVPIDLQGLPTPSTAKELWELTLRPIDHELRGMPPLGDRIGASVARFSAILRYAGLASALGSTLFETYPKANLIKLDLVAGAYKSLEKEQSKAAREKLCHSLGITPCLDSDDDIDAVICSMTSVAADNDLCGPEDYKCDMTSLPRGFRLLKRNPFKSIRVQNAAFSEWIRDRQRHQ